MTMTISEALKQMEGLVAYSGIAPDREALDVIRSRLEVSDAVLDRACTAFRHSGQATFRDDMKAALVAALGDAP